MFSSTAHAAFVFAHVLCCTRRPQAVTLNFAESRFADDPGDDIRSPVQRHGNAVAERYYWTSEFVKRARDLLGQSICDQLNVYALPSGFRLSVVVPVFNEASTIDAVVDRLLATGLPLEIVLVDDGSDDESARRMQQLATQVHQHHDPDEPPSDDVEIIFVGHKQNQGKGSAIRSGVQATTGDVVVIQDADLEYEPSDFRMLLQPILSGLADVVYGTRYGSADRLVSPWWHTQINRALSMFASIAIGPRLTDVETCYKMARADVFRRAAAATTEKRFGIEIELTARFARGGAQFAEKPIRYQHRWRDEGKKIGWRDGVSALRCIVWYGLFRQ